MDWQPIETAPKDGRYIIIASRLSNALYNPVICLCRWWDDAPNNAKKNCWLDSNGDLFGTHYSYCLQPTHWMELLK
jgi:hypothetical protein